MEQSEVHSSHNTRQFAEFWGCWKCGACLCHHGEELKKPCNKGIKPAKENSR